MKHIYFVVFLVATLSACSNQGAVQSNAPGKDVLATAAEIQAIDTNRLGFIRDLQLANGKFAILEKTSSGFELLAEEYDGVLDPYISSDETYKYDSEVSSRAYGYDRYKNHRYDNNLIAVKIGDLWGFVNMRQNGETVIQPQYKEVHPFKEGLAAVLSGDTWGFIDEKGNTVVQPGFAKVQDYFNGICVVTIREGETESFGAINREGKLLFKSEKGKPFKYIDDFYEQKIARAVGVNYETYVVDSAGKILLRDISKVGDRGGPEDPFFAFDEDTGVCTMAYFNQEVYDAQSKKSESGATFYGAFDREGLWVVKPVFKTPDEVFAQVIQLMPKNKLRSISDPKTGKYGYMSATKKWKIEPRYDYAQSFFENNAIIELGKKYGLIDIEGNISVPAIYDSIRHIGGNLYKAESGGKFGVILGNGKIAIPLRYNRIGSYDGLSPLYVEDSGKRGFVDRDGNWVISADKTKSFRGFWNGIAFQYSEVPSESSNSLEHKYLVEPLLPNGKFLFEDKKFFERYEESGI